LIRLADKKAGNIAISGFLLLNAALIKETQHQGAQDSGHCRLWWMRRSRLRILRHKMD